MKVGLLTTWEERCGIAEYARNLVHNAIDVDFVIFGRDQWSWPGLLDRLVQEEIEILHVNHEPGLFYWLDDSKVRVLSSRGIKLVLTYHTSAESGNRTNFTNLFNCVVVHEKNSDGFVHIPLGIPVVHLDEGTLVQETLGTAGFPFPWKGFHPTVKAAVMLELGSVVIAPESRHVDTEPMRQCILEAQPSAVYISTWMPEANVIHYLSTCKVNVFAYSGSPGGISGAVRMGLAAERPLVLTRNRQFRDLFEYEDEIEFIDRPHEEDIALGVNNVLASGKKPNRILKDMSWKESAKKYTEVYASL